MANPLIDQDRADYVTARESNQALPLPAWPRGSKDLPVVDLEVEWVRFSTLNHRTRGEQRADIARTGNTGLFSEDPLGPVAQNAQYAILRSQEGFQDLKKDLASRSQQEPAVITADGILINGNRRTAALRSLYQDDDNAAAHYVRCLVLPSDATREELVDLETELQIARDFKQDYGWINEALLIEELYERERRDFGRVASRMHRDVNDIKGRYEKLQQVHQIVDLSAGMRNHIDFNDNESAFDELAKHIRNKQPTEAGAVRSVYFLGTLAGVNYRKLRHLRRADASELVSREIEADPSLKSLSAATGAKGTAEDSDGLLDELLGDANVANPVESLLSLVARTSGTGNIVTDNGVSIPLGDVLASVNNSINAAAEEAEESERDQTAQSTPKTRVNKAIAEFERALAALPKARTFDNFDENEVRERVSVLSDLLKKYEA